MKISKKVLLLSLALVTSVHADILSSLGFKQEAQIDVVIGDKIQKDINYLQKEIATAESESKTFEEELQTKIERARTKAKEVESALKAEKGDDTYLNKQLFTLKSIGQTLTTLRTAHKSWIASLKNRKSLLEGIQEQRSKKEVEDEKKALYTFGELQVLNHKIANQEDKVAQTESGKSELTLDLDNSKKKADSVERIYKEKLKEQHDFGQGVDPLDEHVRQKSKLLDLEVQLAKYERDLAVLQVKEKQSKLTYIQEAQDSQEKILVRYRQKRDLIVRLSLRVDQQDVADINEKLKKEKRNYLNATDKHLHTVEKLTAKQEKLKKELANIEEKYPDKAGSIANLDEWVAEPITLEDFVALAERGVKSDEMHLVASTIDLERAEINLEKSTFKEHELAAQTVESWYKIKHQLFKSSDQLSKEITSYQNASAELTREKSIYEDKRHTATNRLSSQNKALSNLRAHTKTLKSKKRTIFKQEDTHYTRSLAALEKAQTLVSKRIEITGRLIEVYSKLLVSMSGSVKEINSMVSELQRVSLWHRSGGALSLEGLKDIVPDVKSFLSDIRTLGYSYMSNFSPRVILYKLASLLKNPLQFILLLWKLFLLVFLLFLFYRYLPILEKFLLAVGSEYKGAFLISRVGALLVQFLYDNITGLFIWTFLFFYVGINGAAEIYPSVLFFLFSIVYFVYLAHRFIAQARKFNKDHDYELFPESFDARFHAIGSLFLYSSATILFFREAFILATYAKSALPNVLLAFYSIIVRILLLALIRREDLLSIIPSKTTVGAWCWRAVDRYYYPLLFSAIFIMILSDPHIGGYDNLVSYLFWGLAGTAIVTRLLFLLYTFCRRISSFIFFSSDGETLNQRFQHSKTWYGLTVVVLFFIFFVIGLWFIAWFWGKAIPLDSIGDFFDEKRLAIGFTDGQYQKVSIIDLLRTSLFIPGGFLAAHLVDRFILDRIFSVLLVDPGVHNAISTISYYLVVISVITLGLVQEGFGFLVVYYLLPLLVGMAFALREIFNDFIAYFVLLVQRPLKVGDYVKINDEVRGVVRKITPRAVILRRKRSYHLIVPNAKLMQDVIINWDYTRNFITFPDIIVGIRYAADPNKAKQVLAQAVESVANVLKTPPALIRLDKFGPSGYIFMVRGYISSEMTLQQWNIASDVRLAIVKHLHDNHIEIAFPVRVIRMMGESRDHQYLNPHAPHPVQDSSLNEPDPFDTLPEDPSDS